MMQILMLGALVSGTFGSRAGAEGRTAIRRLLQSPSPDQAAAKICAAPGFADKTCGFANEDELSATTDCFLCGTVFRGLPDPLPAEVDGHISYFQVAIKGLSLSCKGRVLVRSVFKMLEDPPITPQADWLGTNCSNAGLYTPSALAQGAGVTTSSVVRCELLLPASGGSEAERALKAKEGKCWQCDLCSKGYGCPNGAGKVV